MTQVSAWLDEHLKSNDRSVESGAQALKRPFGVDAMVYRDLAGQLKIKPLVELNPRTTMGHVSLALTKRLASGVVGQFRIFNAQQWRVVGPSLESLPLCCSREGHWKSGVIPLADVEAATKLVPAILIGDEAMAKASLQAK